jgi:hypothetical protein
MADRYPSSVLYAAMLVLLWFAYTISATIYYLNSHCVEMIKTIDVWSWRSSGSFAAYQIGARQFLTGHGAQECETCLRVQYTTV